jgi:hypothetical protein
MIYRYFSTHAEATTYLNRARKHGYVGFIVGITCGEYEVRTWK